MLAFDNDRTPSAALVSEHAAFRVMVRELKSELDRLQCDPQSRECQVLLLGRLQAMLERLTRHFGVEEREWGRPGRTLDAATERWVRTLTNQHREMETQLGGDIAELERCLGAGEPVPSECEASVRALLRDLAAHELSEDRLFQRAIFEDLDGT